LSGKKKRKKKRTQKEKKKREEKHTMNVHRKTWEFVSLRISEQFAIQGEIVTGGDDIKEFLFQSINQSINMSQMSNVSKRRRRKLTSQEALYFVGRALQVFTSR
jgi:hypothetical protein